MCRFTCADTVVPAAHSVQEGKVAAWIYWRNLREKIKVRVKQIAARYLSVVLGMLGCNGYKVSQQVRYSV